MRGIHQIQYRVILIFVFFEMLKSACGDLHVGSPAWARVTVNDVCESGSALGTASPPTSNRRLDERMDYDRALDRARTPGGLVWHYTTLDTLALILQNNFLLATGVSFQNDIRETSTADAVFREVLESMAVDDSHSHFTR